MIKGISSPKNFKSNKFDSIKNLNTKQNQTFNFNESFSAKNLKNKEKEYNSEQ